MSNILSLVNKLQILNREINLLVSDVSPCAEEVDEREILSLKCRQFASLKILDQLGKADSFKNVKDIALPNGDRLLWYLRSDDEETEDYDMEEEFTSYQDEKYRFGERFFYEAFKNTGWEICRCQTLRDYEQFDNDLLIKASSTISAHWYSLLQNCFCWDDYDEKDVLNEEGKFLEKLGILPEDSFITISEVLFLFNKNVERMLRIFDTEEEERRGEYGRTVHGIRVHGLFDRYFPEISQPDMSEAAWRYNAYAFGDVYSDRQEVVNFHLTTYEAVLLYVLLDELAVAYLADYDARKAGGRCE